MIKFKINNKLHKSNNKIMRIKISKYKLITPIKIVDQKKIKYLKIKIKKKIFFFNFFNFFINFIKLYVVYNNKNLERKLIRKIKFEIQNKINWQSAHFNEKPK